MGEFSLFTVQSIKKRKKRRNWVRGRFYRIVELKESWEKRWDELKDCIADAVESGRRKLIVVVHVVAVALRLQVERLGENLAEDCRQELVVGDVLDLGPDDLPALLVEGLLVPVGVDCLEQGGDPVVLPHDHRVQGSQAGVVVHPLVARPSTTE